MNYQKANDLLAGRCKASRKIANNTYLKRRGKDIVVRLHSTDVITWHQNGDTTLNSGGWTTCTTRDRINSNLENRVGIYSERGRWFLRAGETVPFEDGITIRSNGTIAGATETLDEVQAEWRETDRENARISRWVRKARGMTRDMSKCTRSWCRCHPRPFHSDRTVIRPCDCGCVLSALAPSKTKLTVEKIAQEDNYKVQQAMVCCYGLSKLLADAPAIVQDKTADYSLIRYSLSYVAVAGLRSLAGEIMIVDGACSNVSDALAWFGDTAKDALFRKVRGTTEDIVREAMLRNL